MGKEYREDLGEIRRMIKKGELEDALYELDGINWRKVRNINLMMEGARLYEQAGKPDVAREILEMAHERSPIGRMILYELCLLCIRLNDLDEAKAYYEDFVELAPKEYHRYILKYRLAQARGADDPALIAILEELKDNEFLEEWAYELACLYHRTSQVDKCIDLCDEIALYFGEGPYVEKALELKMIYHPLNKDQESQYRHSAGSSDGLTEVHAGDNLNSGEIVAHDMTIPKVEIRPERFNTINLQAEIKKNIDEIMQATETGEVSETMENLKDLIGDIPYLAVPDEKQEKEEEAAKPEEEPGIMEMYQQHLNEEYDGQLSLDLPEKKGSDPQIEGQMTIKDVMDNWEKTKRAAEAALQEADAKKLEDAKKKALEEANHIMDRLENVAPQLDAGIAPQELLKQEYLSKTDEPKTAAEAEEDDVELPKIDITDLPSEERKESEKFSIPKVGPGGEISGVGLEVPVVGAAGVLRDHEPVSVKPSSAEKAAEWTPKSLDAEDGVRAAVAAEESVAAVEEPEADAAAAAEEQRRESYRDANRLLASVNDMLQREIDRANGYEVEEEIPKPQAEMEDEIELPKIDFSDIDPDEDDEDLKQLNPTQAEVAEAEREEKMDQERILTEEEPEEETEEQVDDSEVLADALIHGTEPDLFPSKQEEAEAEAVEDSFETEEDSLPEEDFDQTAVLPAEETMEQLNVPYEEVAEVAEEEPELSVAEEMESKEAEPVVDKLSDSLLSQAEELVDEARNELPTVRLTEEQRDLFEYFTPIDGMESHITAAIAKAKYRLEKGLPATSGNVAIVGGHGSGKTTLAKGIIEVLQQTCGKPGRNVGRIDGDKLNNKDLQSLYSKIRGGCLVIERAGEIKKETIVSLNFLMNNDTDGTLVFIEDTKDGIDHVLRLDGEFAKRFSQKIVIPLFSVEELVNFGRKYARDNGYEVDEMAVLAMYDRINKMQRLDRPTYLTEVAEIMDEAIERSSRKGFFHRKHVNEDGKSILVEKDFL